MNQSRLFRLVLFSMVLWGPVFAQDAVQKTEKAEVDTYSGEVVGAYNNDMFVLRENGEYYLVLIDRKHWPLGISRGDKVNLKAKQITFSTKFNNELNALEVQKRSSNPGLEPLYLNSLSEIMEGADYGELVFTFGRIARHRGEHESVLEESGNRVLLDFSKVSETNPLNVDTICVVLGIHEKTNWGPVIRVSMAKPLRLFAIPGAPRRVQEIETVIKDRPEGKTVRVRGRISIFIGKENVAVLYDGDNILIVRRSAKHMSFAVQAGYPVEVIGIFDLETHEDKEYGVLREAQILPPQLLKARDMLQKSERMD